MLGGRGHRPRLQPNQLDSSRAMESKRNSKITRADKIAIVTILTSSLEARIKRHAAIDEQRCTLDIIGLVTGQPDGSTANFLRFADSLVGDQFEQFVVVLGRVPSLHVNRCPDRARRN